MLSKNQMKALKELTAAFKKCKAVNISFCGMDCDLLAYDREELSSQEKELGGLHEAQGKCDHEIVNTHGTYLDSGGW